MRTDYHTLLNSQGNPKELDFERYDTFWEQNAANYIPPIEYKWFYIGGKYEWLPENMENW